MKDNSNKDSNHLLLIDDDPNLILLVKDYLEFQGHEVTTAENGREAWEILDNKVPDMIICDVMMPEMDGYALIEKVRQDPRLNSIPVMFLLDKEQNQDRVKKLKTKTDVYMVKPFEPEELVAQVEHSIKHNSQVSFDTKTQAKVPSNVELTPSELKVLRLLAKGLSIREIADQLNTHQRMVACVHGANMLEKTGLKNPTELVRWALESQLLEE